MLHEIFEEIHPTKNPDIDVDKLTLGSYRKVWWIGKCGHEWEARVFSRVGGTGCPYCSGSKILVGFNDLGSNFPKVASEWHPTKNGTLTPQQITSYNNKKVWWQCEKGHEWEVSSSNRLNRVKSNGEVSKCPYCSGKKVVAGENSISATHPEVAMEWHPTKNGTVTPEGVSKGSRMMAWWVCKEGHEWQASVCNRSAKNSRCPLCSGLYHLSLREKDAKVAGEWHPTKNGKLTPDDVGPGTDKKVWWKCERGHEWEAVIYSRNSRGITKGKGCPVCVNAVILAGFNDLASVYPEIAKDWLVEKNDNIKPEEVGSKARRLAWWQCENGHEWKAAVYARTQGLTGCPRCAAQSFSSKAEMAIAESFIDEKLVLSDRKVLNGRELDIYVPGRKFAIEFNGIYWHSEIHKKDKNYHYKKWLDCKDEGIQLVQIWEDEWNSNPDRVLKSLRHKMGLGNQRKVMARKTKVSIIDKVETESFLNENHVQGFASGSYYLGLTEEGSQELVAVIVLKKEANTQGKTLNIIRYATSAHVIGGFTKLLKYVETFYKPEKFITFSDHCISDGKLYESNGFTADKEIPPDYMYVIRGQRKHKFGYRLKRFKNDESLEYVEGMTEKELAELNQLPRIWDAGKTRWVKRLQP